MATWVRQNTNRITVNGADLAGTLNLDNGTAPGDFDPAGVTSVLVSIQVDAPDNIDDNFHMRTSEGWSLDFGGTLAASAYDTGTVTDLAMPASNTASGTDSSPSTAFSTASWESAVIVAGGTSAAYAVYSAQMKNDNGLMDIDIGDCTVTITYTPGGQSTAATFTGGGSLAPTVAHDNDVATNMQGGGGLGVSVTANHNTAATTQGGGSLVATAVGPPVLEYVYDIDKTLQSHTGDTNWTTIASIAGTSLTANTKYLILATAAIGGTNISQRFGQRVRTADDTNIETKSLADWEPQLAGPTGLKSYLFAHSFTTDATPADVVFEHRCSTLGSDTVYARGALLLLINLDKAKTYFESIDGASAEFSTTAATTVLSEIAGSSLTVGQVYLVFGHAQVDIGSAVHWFDVSLHRANNASTQALASWERAEGEDVVETRNVGFVQRHQASSGTPNITLYGQEEASGGMTTDSSYLIAIPISLFEDFTQSFTVGALSLSTGGGDDVAESITAYAPTTSGADHLLVGQLNRDNAQVGRTEAYLDDGTSPFWTGADTDQMNNNWDTAKDGEHYVGVTIEPITGTGNSIRLMADAVGSNHDVSHRWIGVISLATGDEVPSRAATFTGGGSLAPTVAHDGAKASTHTGGGSLAPAQTGAHAAAATATGGGGLGVTVVANRTMAATFEGGGSLTVAAASTRPLTPTFNGGGSLAPAQTGAHASAATTTGGGSLAPAATGAHNAAATAQGGGSLTPATTGDHNTSSTHTGGGSLTATVVVGGGAPQVAATFTGGGSLAPTVAHDNDVATTAQGGGELTTAVDHNHATATTFEGGGSIAPAQTSARSVAAGFAGGGSITSSTTSTRPLTPTFNGGGSITTAVDHNHVASSALEGGGSLTPAQTGAHNAASTLTGGGSLTVAANQPSGGAAATFTGGGGMTVTVTAAHATRSFPTIGESMGGPAFYGGGSLSVSTTPARQPTFTGGGGLGVTVTATHNATGQLEGGGALTATVVPGPAGPTAVAQFTGGGSMAATVVATFRHLTPTTADVDLATTTAVFLSTGRSSAALERGASSGEYSELTSGRTTAELVPG